MLRLLVDVIIFGCGVALDACSLFMGCFGNLWLVGFGYGCLWDDSRLLDVVNAVWFMWYVDADLFGGYFGCLVCELPMIVALDSVCLYLLTVVYFVFRGYGCLPCDFCCLCFACLCGFWG